MTSLTTTSPPLVAAGLTVSYADRDVLHGVDIRIEPGTLTAIVGPNGCGKSTLLKTLARHLRPRCGRITVGADDLAGMSSRELAQVIGVLPQSPIVPEQISVQELVSRGRDPHRRWYRPWSQADQDAVDEAIAGTGLRELRDRPVDELSGGQRQRAWIALLLAQQTGVLLLDEPTSFLDIAHQIDTLELLRRLAHDHGRTVVVVLHELTLAARYADVVVAMRDGRIIAFGAPASTLTPKTLRTVFDVEARILDDGVTAGPVIVPLGRAHASDTAKE